MSRKVLFLAWWIHHVGLANRDVLNLQTVFKMKPRLIDHYTDHLAVLQKGLRPIGCLTKGLKTMGPQIELLQKAKNDKTILEAGIQASLAQPQPGNLSGQSMASNIVPHEQQNAAGAVAGGDVEMEESKGVADRDLEPHLEHNLS